MRSPVPEELHGCTITATRGLGSHPVLQGPAGGAINAICKYFMHLYSIQCIRMRFQVVEAGQFCAQPLLSCPTYTTGCIQLAVPCIDTHLSGWVGIAR